MIAERTNAQKVSALKLKWHLYSNCFPYSPIENHSTAQNLSTCAWGKFPDAFSNRGSLYLSDRYRVNPAGALDSLLAAIRGNTTDDMLGAILRGILSHFGQDLCSQVGAGEHLKNAAMMMMNLGDIKLAARFLRLVQQHNQKYYLCFCNNIWSQYIVEGDRGMCGKSLVSLSRLSVFQPTHARIAAHTLWRRLINVLPSFPTVRFIEMVDASPIRALTFLAGLPPTVKVVSARSHLVGATV